MIKNGCITNFSIKDDFGFNCCDVVYTDPPWGEGNVKYRGTICNKQNNEGIKQVEYTEMMDSLFLFVENFCNTWFFLEQGLAQKDYIVEKILNHGWYYQEVYIKYRSGSRLLPNVLFIINKINVIDSTKISNYENIRGQDLVDAVIYDYCGKESIVCDPFCGMGYTAKSCVKYGHIFLGNEINKKRLAKTEKILANA